MNRNTARKMRLPGLLLPLLALPVILLVLFVGPVAPFRSLFYAFLFKIVVHEPLQEIHQAITSPESVYWQDDVRPGFDTAGRKFMVEQYLDGMHLKVLALNGNDGKIYLYRADEGTFLESERLRPARDRKRKELSAMRHEADLAYSNSSRDKAAYKTTQERSREIDEEFKTSPECAAYDDQQRKEYQGILDKAEVFDSASQLPPMRYQVHFYPLDHWWQILGVYHADQINITETATGKVIAYSRRYMKAAYWWEKINLGWRYSPNDSPGNQRPYFFPDKVLFTYMEVKESG